MDGSADDGSSGTGGGGAVGAGCRLGPATAALTSEPIFSLPQSSHTFATKIAFSRRFACAEEAQDSSRASQQSSGGCGAGEEDAGRRTHLIELVQLVERGPLPRLEASSQVPVQPDELHQLIDWERRRHPRSARRDDARGKSTCEGRHLILNTDIAKVAIRNERPWKFRSLFSRSGWRSLHGTPSSS